mmetsp:Transcript_955/g.2253  ORF Transcript_955/g.2253 Transcript_955/m.2253 type:complete len:959 (+) Transcript_955:40-2916(+)
MSSSAAAAAAATPDLAPAELSRRVDTKLAGDASVLVANLVASDDAVVPTVRSVVERGWSEGFSRSLEEYISQKEDELRGLCNFHFGEFSRGVDDIAQLRKYSVELRQQISDMDSALQEQGARVLETSEMLLRFYRVQRHLRVTKQELRKASSCVGLVRRARQQMKDKAYFEALQSIDLVREVIHGKDVHRLLNLDEGQDATAQIANIDGDSRFSTALERWIPRVIDKIKLDVNAALTEWFVTARDKAEAVGAKALQLVRQGKTPAVSPLRKNIAALSSSATTTPAGSQPASPTRRYVRKESFRTRNSSDALMQWEHRENIAAQGPDVAEICLAAEGVSLAPVYQYMDIQKYLGTEEEAVQFYKENRLPQAALQSMMPVDLRKVGKDQFRLHAKSLLHKMTGFLVIEGVVSRSLNLIAQYEIAAIWESMLDTLVPLIQTELRSRDAAKNPTSNLDLIQLLMDIAMLLGRSGAKSGGALEAADAREDLTAGQRTIRMLDASRLVAACYDERLAVGASLADACGETLQQLVSADNFSPFTMESYPEGDPIRIAAQNLVVLAEEVDASIATQRQEPSFSAMVPRACVEIFTCMTQAFQLGRQLGGSLVVKSSNGLSSPTSSSSPADAVLNLPTSGSNGISSISSPRSQNGKSFASNISKGVWDKQPNSGATEDGDIQTSAGAESISPQSAVQSAIEISKRALAKLYIQTQTVALNENTSPEVLCQCSANLEHLDRAKVLFENHARQLAKIDGEYSFKQPCEKFADLCREVQPRVVDALRDRVEAIMSSGAYSDWTPQDVPSEPHVFVSDAVQYLEVMLAPTSCLRLLPDAQRQVAQFTALMRIVDSLLEFLTGDEVSEINALSVHQVKLDLDLLRKLASKTDVPAQEVLLTLEQMVDLLRSSSLQDFLRPETRGKKYACLGPTMVKSVLRKYQQLATARLPRGDKIPVLKQTDISRVIAGDK